MKVVMICPGLIGYRLSLSRALAATKHVELLVLTDEQSEIAGDDSGYRTSISFRLAGRRFDSRFARRFAIRKVINLWLGLVSIARSLAMCVRERPDLVHVQGILYIEPFCLLCIAALKTLRFRVVFTPHNAGPRRPRPGMELMWMMFMRMSNRVVAHSNIAARRFNSTYGVNGAKIDVIPFANYDVAASYAETYDRHDARISLGIREAASIVLFFGQVRPYKGLEFLIKAMPQVVQHVPDARLMVIGRAPYGFEMYDRLIHSLGIEDRTTTRTEWVDEKEHTKYFVASDVIVLPYRNLPEIDASAVVSEALSFGRAVIASDVGGIAEQVIEGVTGLKVPPENVDILAETIWQLLLDSNRRRLMESAARERAKELSWDRFAERTLAVYNAAVQA